MVLAFEDLLRDDELIPRPVAKRLALRRVVAQGLPLGGDERGERRQARRAADQAQSRPQLESTRSTYRFAGREPSASARFNRARPMW